MKRMTFKIPNALIQDDRLSFSARRVGAVLYSRRNALGVCHKSLEELSVFARCTPGTVRKAVQELSEAGYITAEKTFCYRKDIGAVVYGKTAYTCNLTLLNRYTSIPRSVFALELNNSSFVIYLFLLMSAGNGRRAFPSISCIERGIGVSHATVCRALQVLRELPEMLIQRCKTVKRTFAANSYHFVVGITSTVLKPVKVRVSRYLAPLFRTSIIRHKKPGKQWFLERRGSLIFNRLC